LANGVWNYTSVRKEVIASYSGYIQKGENLTVLSEWNGISLPTSDAESIKTGITEIGTSANETQQAAYDLEGRRIGQQPGKGLVIRNGVVVFMK
jgi:hypothetical protein